MGKRGNNEGSFTKRSDGRWMARVVLPNGKRRSFYGQTFAEAKEKLRKAQRSIEDGLPVPPARLTVQKYLETWLEAAARPSLRPYTFQSYKMLVHRHIIPELGRIKLAALAPSDVQALMNTKAKQGLSARTVQYIHAVLRRALGDAERQGTVPRNVARLVGAPHVPQANIAPLNPSEGKRLLAQVQGDRLEALYTVALAVGLRQSEALGLRWQDVHLEAGTISIRVSLQRINKSFDLAEPKTERSRRTVKLPEVCVEALKAHKARQDAERALLGDGWDNPWGLVFTEADGSPMERSRVTRRFQQHLKVAEIEKHRFHDLRHTCATLLLAQGVPLRVVMETLGHSQMSTTADIYAHVLPVLMADAAAKMDAALA